MEKRYLRSDFSVEETRFYTCGRPIIGTDNILTGLIKFVGMYDELASENRASEIASYNPNWDCFFKRENWGYTVLRKELSKTDTPVSRRYIKSLSRKWPMSRVVISFDSLHTITVLFAYITARPDLKAACSRFLHEYNLPTEWNRIMPIQYEFLGVRIEDRHDNWQIASKIINDLTKVALEV